MLRRILVVFVVLGLALSFWTVPAAAQPEIHRFRFRGLSASAAFSSIDDTECILTDVFVSATNGNVKVDGQPDETTEGFIDISQFDTCTGEQLLAASGFSLLPPDEFVIDQELNQAALDTTFVVDDFVSGATFRVDVSISWSGAGDISTQRSVFYFKSPGVRIFSHVKGTFRDAEAIGTVTGLDTNFTPEPAVFAELANVTNGELTSIH